MEQLYLVTGAAGHLGQTVLNKLLEQGKQVRALVLPGEKHLPDSRADIYFGDICKKETLTDCFHHPDGTNLVVIHCAGIVSIATKY